MQRDQEDIERLKSHTRAMLAQLEAARSDVETIL
jgi:hypothetical protein